MFFGIRKNVEYTHTQFLSPWRKVAMGTWQTVGDPSVYGILEFDCTKALEYLENQKKISGRRLTITHLVGKMIAEMIRRHPVINCTLRWGRFYQRKSIDIFFQVASDDQGNDLSGIVIRDADKKTLITFGEEVEAKAARVRKEGDPDYKEMKKNLAWLPGFLAHFFVNLSGFVMYGLNLWSKGMGVPRDSFGSVMVTNIGSLGLEMAFVPLVPYSRVPLLVAVTAIKEKPVQEDGQIKFKPHIQLCSTFDHRVIDGVHAAHMAKTLRKIFANPEQELNVTS